MLKLVLHGRQTDTPLPIITKHNIIKLYKDTSNDSAVALADAIAGMRTLLAEDIAATKLSAK